MLGLADGSADTYTNTGTHYGADDRDGLHRHPL